MRLSNSNVPSLVVVIPAIGPGCAIGVRRINDVMFERPLRSGDSVPVELIVEGAPDSPAVVEVLASVSYLCCEASWGPHDRAVTPCSDEAGAADPYAADYDCVANI